MSTDVISSNQASSNSLDSRISTMHRRDVAVAWAFIVGLWFAIIYVAIVTWTLAPMPAMRIVLLSAGAVVLILNTAAVLAMLRHYREDRDFMYGLDLQFLDEARAARLARRTAKGRA